MVNNGELKKFYVEEAHEPIINKSDFKIVQSLLKTKVQKFQSGTGTTSAYPFTGMIQCGCCGKNYRRKTTSTGIYWCCATYNTKGKKYCPTAKMIPENTLISICCDVLKMLNFDVEKFSAQIEKIIVPAPNELIFFFSDGHEEYKTWKDRSRSESWTEEMRKAVGERSRKWHEKSR